MARRGRRLTIGGSGLGLADDDSLSQTGARGEVNRYKPIPEDTAAAEAARLSVIPEPVPEDQPVVVTAPPESGGDAPGQGEGPGEGEGEGEGSGVGSGDEGSGQGGEGLARGGLVGPKGGTVEAGEFVIKKSAVAKYGKRFLMALNSGKAKLENGNEVEIPKRRMRRLA